MFRVIWQYAQSRMGPLEAEAIPLRPLPSSPKDTLFSGIDLVGNPEPVFSRPPVALRASMLQMSEGFRADPVNDLASYQHAFVPDYETAESLKKRLAAEPDIWYVDIQARPTPAFIFDEKRKNRVKFHKAQFEPLMFNSSPSPNYEHLQNYLGPAPQGIDARHAWEVPGGLGDGVTIIDIEHGWNFEHEDLLNNQIGMISNGINQDDDHGTAVLGIYSGDHNGTGIAGIVPEATAGAASAEYLQSELKWNAADTIFSVARRLKPGDVILLEMHAPGPLATNPAISQDGYVAIEYWQPEFAAIQYAVSLGIYVVEAAGNGGSNFDDVAYVGRFDRGLRDSGAIVVGGGSSPLQPNPRSRISWSNYGSRVDVQGWGEDIVTTGGRQERYYHDLRDHEDPSKCYTDSFGGTSGASPIVAGAIAAISACVKASGSAALTPFQMRELLVNTGTPQTDGEDGPATEKIGPLPDLKRALESLNML